MQFFLFAVSFAHTLEFDNGKKSATVVCIFVVVVVVKYSALELCERSRKTRRQAGRQADGLNKRTPAGDGRKEGKKEKRKGRREKGEKEGVGLSRHRAR